MSETILDKIFAAKKLRVEAAKKSVGMERIMETATARRVSVENNRLRSALDNRDRLNIIAEFKRASPSKGLINDAADPPSIAAAYAKGGAAAISVLTEEDFFKGSLDDLRAVHNVVDVPILIKDFIFDAYQIYEAAEAGADAILLIAAMLDDESLKELHHLAEVTMGLDALVEVHTLEELERVNNIGAKLIGVNNRNLKTFNISLEVSRELIGHTQFGTMMVAESGLNNREDIIELANLGYAGFLVGETLMRSGDPVKSITALTADEGR